MITHTNPIQNITLKSLFPPRVRGAGKEGYEGAARLGRFIVIRVSK
jgi:hypothetical protein